ncbi:MAG: ABC transporter permease [Fimbriimonadaceae bacterium]|nr:ABC transporter permease [Fimbriimonadaceae bacterium]
MIKHIFIKEIRETFRDRRVISGAFVGPIFLMFLFVFAFGTIETTLKKPKAPVIHVVRSANEPAFLTELRSNHALRIQEVSSEEVGQKLLREGKAKLILKLSPTFDEDLAGRKAATIQALYDPGEVLSTIALRTFQEMVNLKNRSALDQTLRVAGIPVEAAQPIVLKTTELTRDEALGGSMLIGMLPYLIVIWAFYGGFSAVSDLVAGEKERTTLETLLITPVKRFHVAMGKFLALSLICLASSLSSLVTVLLIGASGTSLARSVFPNGMNLTPLAVVAILAVLVPLVAFFAGTMLAISAFAKNTREAQTHLTLLSFIVLVPAMASQFIGFTDWAKDRWVSFVPILNSSNAIRSALLGRVDPTDLAATVTTSLLLGAVGIFLAVRLFEREEVLARI